MGFVFEGSRDVKELGVVAELCPQCERATPCDVLAQYEGMHVCFVILAGSFTQAVCVCRHCGRRFRGELERYAAIVPQEQADSMAIEELTARTQPGLRERLELAQKLRRYQAHPQFLETMRAVQSLRHGRLADGLTDELMQWENLDSFQRDDLAARSERLARTSRFANSLASRFPEGAGCLAGLLVCIAFWSMFLLAPAVRDLWWGTLLVLASFCAAGYVAQRRLARSVRSWTRTVLIPEARESQIRLENLLAILDDMPVPGPHSEDELRRVKEQEMAIREELAAVGVIADATARSPSR